MGLVLLTKDMILADYLRADCPLLTDVSDCPSSLKANDLCIVDADSFPAPYPEQTCLLISRKKQETQFPVLIRPLCPSAVTEVLTKDSELLPRLIKEQKAIVTPNGSLSFPPLEFALLSFLFDRKGEIVPREKLARCLSEDVASRTENTDALLTVYIYRLRKKLAPLGLTLVSHHRRGYSLQDIKK